MLSYNVFRARERDVLCAVPEDRPVPRFIRGNSWQFQGRITHEANLPRALKVAGAFNGFYIFHPFETPEPAKALGPDEEQIPCVDAVVNTCARRPSDAC
jgi:hypothetical protein